MIVHLSRFRGYGEADCTGLKWEPWCDCRYADNLELRSKCKAKPWSCCPLSICPPWAEPSECAGSACRGLPKPRSGTTCDIAYGIQTGLTAVSLIDKVFTPKTVEKIAQGEQNAIINKQMEQNARIAEQRAEEQKQKILKYAKYGVYGMGALLGLAIIVRLARPPRPPLPPPGEKK